MNYFLAICASIFFMSCSAFSQQNTYLKHKVLIGETIPQIALKYNVTPFDIYRLNPDAQKGVQPNTILIIPPKNQKGKEKNQTTTSVKNHEVLAKETLYSIAKLYAVKIEDLEKANPEILTEGLKIGQVLRIPFTKKGAISETKSAKTVYHEVLPKETKYAIAKKYGITVAQLEKQNPEIAESLTVGYKLFISGKAAPVLVTKEISKNKIIKVELTKKTQPIDYVIYEVKPKETLYSLLKKFGITQEALLSLNPELANGVKDGMILKIPATHTVIDAPKKEFADLSKKIARQDKKQLVLLLPFNISRLESDTINSTAARLKKDKFLNMTLDFYSGALMAIDSAKTLGLNLTITIVDSQETKNSSNVAALVQQNNLENVDAIIGPFYQSNVETLAEVLNKSNVPVISPLSKETGKSFTNLYQSLPPNDVVRNAMFDYMRSKQGNLIAVIDPKKTAIKQYILDYQKDVKLVSFNEKATFVADSLKKLLVKDKINFVVMESEKTGMIFAITNAMLSSLTEYQLQLVILEPNPTLDFEEIALSRLTKLKMTYPSLTRENDSPEALVFENTYKRINKIFPSPYAIRGFDVTFDTMLRLSQNNNFEETIQNVATEQVENKFDYKKNISEGYTNKGVYILYYDTDLTIKEAN